MDFGDILDQWSKQKQTGKRHGADKTGRTYIERKSRAGNEAPAAGKSPGANTNTENPSEFEQYLNSHRISDKDAAHASEPVPPGVRRSAMRKMEPEATLDLHGYFLEEALLHLQRFLTYCKSKGIRKILIIHGKGFHSVDGPVLRKGIRDFLSKSEDVGETGVPPRHHGGDGATWAILRYRSR